MNGDLAERVDKQEAQVQQASLRQTFDHLYSVIKIPTHK